MIPHTSANNGELYAVSTKAVSNKPEKQQEQIPLVEYAEIDNNKKIQKVENNVTNVYDEINENNIDNNTGVSDKQHNTYLHMHTYVSTYLYLCMYVACIMNMVRINKAKCDCPSKNQPSSHLRFCLINDL